MLWQPDNVFDPPWLLTPINLVFETAVPLAGAALAAYVYRRTGVAPVLALGGGLLAVGLGSGLLSAILLFTLGTNASLSLHNVSMLAGAIGQFVVALAAILGTRIATRPDRPLVLVYLLTAAAIGAVLAAVLAGVTPAFWTPDHGSTDLRSSVLATAMALFGLSAFAWWQTAVRDRQIRFLNWYVPGLALFAIGIGGVLGQSVVGGLVSWIGRIGQFAGCFYMLIALSQETLASNRSATTLGIALFQAALPFRSLVESTTDAVVALEPGGRVLYWNEGACKMFGYDGFEAFDAFALDLMVAPAGMESSRSALRQLLDFSGRTPASGRGNLVLANREGHRFPAEIAVFAGNENPSLIICVIQDTSERVKAHDVLERRVRARTAELERANAELERANAELERANSAKDEFLGLVSHELRTPITTILAAGSLLERRLGHADADAVIPDLIADANRLAAVVDNLLVLARLEAGRGGACEPVALDRFLHRLIGRLRHEYPDRRIDFSSQPGVIVDSNEEQLELVVRNLVGNALKYSPANAPVEVTLAKDSDEAVVAVLDRGPGIPEGDAERLFEAFYRAERSMGKPGMGIGLAVCHRIMESLGGKITASRRSDRPGSRFEFRLPLAAVDPEVIVPVEA